jgi:hypothetical protein
VTRTLSRKIRIGTVRNSSIDESADTVTYAAQEIARCFHAAFGVTCSIAPHGEMLVGEASAMRSCGDLESLNMSSDQIPAPDPFVDEILVDVILGAEGVSGVVCGSNPRSTLVAAYRLLHAIGYRWLHPGKTGEVPPPPDFPNRHVHVSGKPTYGHRGVCIEGAASYEHVRDVVTWLPRVGMNAYFIQFRDGYPFFERWYTRHSDDPGVGPAHGDFGPDDARRIVGRLTKDIRKRGLHLHAVGHGWTCEPFGIPVVEWREHTGPIPDGVRDCFAQIDGRRGLHGGIPLNTNLCYSNAAVRNTIIDAIVDYAVAHPQVSYLHFWLADGMNNHCECDTCRRARPADFYVMMLNGLCTRLDAAGVDTKIVFLVYVDLLWPPENMKLVESDRFVLMFAPITRTYSEPFPSLDRPSEPSDVAGAASTDLPSDYVRNRLSFPASPAANVAYLRAWQNQFGGDSFDFDYHLMWDHYLDPGSISLSRTLHADVANLAGLQLNGYMSCQVQRASFPTGLPMYVLAATLWDRDRAFGDICDEYFTASFGEQAAAIRAYLERLSELFVPLLSGQASALTAENVPAFEEARALARDFVNTAPDEGLVEDPTGVRRAAIHRLVQHAELTELLADALIAAAGGLSGADRKWQAVEDHAFALEAEVDDVFDALLYTQVLGRRLFGRP